MATSHFISPQNYIDHAAEFADRDSRMVQRHGGIVFYHGGEFSPSHLSVMAELSFNAINIGERADIGEIKKLIGKKKCIMGNLDPIKVLLEGTPADVEKAVVSILGKAKQDGGYMFCTGEGVPYNVRPENVKAMIDAVNRHGKY